MKRNVGIGLYPLVFAGCILILIVGITGIAIRAIVYQLIEGVIHET